MHTAAITAAGNKTPMFVAVVAAARTRTLSTGPGVESAPVGGAGRTALQGGSGAFVGIVDNCVSSTRLSVLLKH